MRASYAKRNNANPRKNVANTTSRKPAATMLHNVPLSARSAEAYSSALYKGDASLDYAIYSEQQ